jgi:putative transposase
VNRPGDSVLRELLSTFIHTLMGAEANALCGAGYGERAVTNGRTSATATVTGTFRFPHRIIGSGDPQAAAGFLLPGLAAGTPQTRRAGPDDGGGHLLPAGGLHAAYGQARRDVGHHVVVEVAGIGMAKELDTTVEAFRTRPLDAGPYTFVAADSLVLKVREVGRVVNVHALIAVGVNAELN